ncbi:MAG: hypothetical protein Kow00108_20890 [Calditrichia bacterium]
MLTKKNDWFFGKILNLLSNINGYIERRFTANNKTDTAKKVIDIIEKFVKIASTIITIIATFETIKRGKQ